MYFRHGVQMSDAECSTMYYKIESNGDYSNSAVTVVTQDTENDYKVILSHQGSQQPVFMQQEVLKLNNTDSAMTATSSISLNTQTVAVSNGLTIASDWQAAKNGVGDLSFGEWDTGTSTFTPKVVYHTSD